MNKKKLRSVYSAITLLFLFMMGSGYTHANERRQLSLPINSEQLIAYYQKSTTPDISELYLLPEYQQQAKHFTQQEADIPVKGEHWGTNTVDMKMAFYEIGHFKTGDNLYKLIIYNRVGEADTVLLNIQLNSYDSQGVLIDALLLDSRYGYEDIERFAEFVIDTDHLIHLSYYVIRRYEITEDGIINKVKYPVSALYGKEKYKIDNGIFQLVSQTDF